jgi:hypothetical protein
METKQITVLCTISLSTLINVALKSQLFVLPIKLSRKYDAGDVMSNDFPMMKYGKL